MLPTRGFFFLETVLLFKGGADTLCFGSRNAESFFVADYSMEFDLLDTVYYFDSSAAPLSFDFWLPSVRRTAALYPSALAGPCFYR